MMDDVKRRVELVELINGVAANIDTAQERLDKAIKRFDDEHGTYNRHRREYTMQYAALHTTVDPRVRLSLINDINNTLSLIESHRKTMDAAGAEKGTAKAELAKLVSEREKLDGYLSKLLPTKLLIEERQVDTGDWADPTLDAVSPEPEVAARVPPLLDTRS